ncbi:FAD-dependent oxidoreductase [Leifsonia flava]|uniref:FAD-dependent oxidoreductase n=1 Tax=Orlajensenia leifsoniae TaxID=2561933 RepID=A0A4Y9R6G2_9MICO|nr:FAD-dependent oxidoreductase [Leifsonia flava]TFV99930.1 FAD-dependent oxidoreductase [Leifsonia flava]
MKHQIVESDITVIGGGLSGVSAAISAARLGKRVALVGNRPVLGGNSSSEVRVWVVGATAHGMQRFARESGVIGELYVENQYRNPEGNPIHWDEVVFDAVRAEPNIQLFLNTDVRSVQTDDRDGEPFIHSVVGWTMGSEIETTFLSPYFIDATGDGLVGDRAGAEYMLGREAKSDFGEDWAPEVADREFLGSTILFYTKDTGKPVRFVAPDSAKDISTTPIPESRIIRSGDSGAHYWWIEWGGELDIVHENERIRDELRSVIFGIWDYIKNSGRFDAETLDLEWVGSMPGKREYRRFVGDHVLTQNDILEQRDFDDAVAFGGWSIDLHPVEGMYGTVAGAHQRYSNGIFGIPFRCYYSRSVPNLLMAGRDISATHVAFGSTRVMATCAVGGEAAGTGAALALDLGVQPRALAPDHAADLRQLLLRQDASVFGVRNEDPLDIARTARVSASSTLTTLDSQPDDGSTVRLHRLDHDLGVLLPVDPQLDSVTVLLSTAVDTSLEVSLWTTGKRQNAVPVHQELRSVIAVPGSEGAQWVTIPLSWTPSEPENVVVVFEANPHVSIELTDAPAPGVLALAHQPEDDGDANVAVSHDEPIVQWPAHILRGWGARLRVHPPTAAYDVAKVAGGYQRPYGGPQMWVSAAGPATRDEWVLLDWDEPKTVTEIRLVFDDDVDVELNTLHHHRSPHVVFPQLVRDYAVEGRTAQGWETLVTETGNRRRHRVHDVRPSSPIEALRVSITATNGDAHARIVAVRAYE